jgi:hypothetical protein
MARKKAVGLIFVLLLGGVLFLQSGGQEGSTSTVEVRMDYTGVEQLEDVTIQVRDGLIENPERVEEAEVQDRAYRLGELENTKVAEFTTSVEGTYNLTLDVETSTEEVRQDGSDVSSNLETVQGRIEVKGDRVVDVELDSEQLEDYWRITAEVSE